ncbi:MAG: DedA family protein [Erysipelotrichia bacterium]|nr:DedA family protein [Erysipelotrichia bacterium]
MSAWLIDILNQFGYLGIALLIAIENIFPPIPSEIILTFSGFMTTRTHMTPLFVIIFATIGSLLGAYFLYYIARYFSEEKLYQLADSKLGKRLGFKKESIHKTMVWFQTKGKYGTLFGRCIPVIRSLISIPAGMAQMPLGQFSVFTFIGSVIWNTILVMLGNTLGESWHQVVNLFNTYTNIMLIIMAMTLLIGFFIIKHKKKR